LHKISAEQGGCEHVWHIMMERVNEKTNMFGRDPPENTTATQFAVK